MLSRHSWALIAAAIAAVVSVTAAVVVVMDRDDGTDSGASSITPGVVWSLDAATYLHRPFGAFSDPRGGASYRSGTPGFVVDGDTLITIAGSPTDAYVLDDAVVIGIDASSGRVRWRVPAPDVEGCGGTPVDGKLYCYAQSRGTELVSIDTATGRAQRRSIGEFVFGLATDDDTLYVAEGDPEDDDVRVHAGTFADISAHWTRAMDIGAAWESVYEDQVLAVTDGVGLVTTGSESVQFDAADGRERWRARSQDCVRNASLLPGGVVVDAVGTCSDSATVLRQVLRGRDGRVVATSRSSAVQSIPVDVRPDPQGPVIMGDAAYDRRTGARRWGADRLVTGDGGALGTAIAVVGRTVVVRDGPDGPSAGLDLANGDVRWSRSATPAFTPRAARGDFLVGDDGSTMTAIDVRSGRPAWSIPFSSVDPDPEVFGSQAATIAHGRDWIHSSDRRIVDFSTRR